MSNSFRTVRRLYPQDPQGGGPNLKKVLLIVLNLFFLGAAAWYLKERYDESQRQSTRTLYINPSVEKMNQGSTSEGLIYSSDIQSGPDSLFNE